MIVKGDAATQATFRPYVCCKPATQAANLTYGMRRLANHHALEI